MQNTDIISLTTQLAQKISDPDVVPVLEALTEGHHRFSFSLQKIEPEVARILLIGIGRITGVTIPKEIIDDVPKVIPGDELKVIPGDELKTTTLANALADVIEGFDDSRKYDFYNDPRILNFFQGALLLISMGNGKLNSNGTVSMPTNGSKDYEVDPVATNILLAPVDPTVLPELNEQVGRAVDLGIIDR